MPKFSERSLAKLETCDPRLQQVFHAVVAEFDCTVLEGHRDKERQNLMVTEGKSKTLWAHSKRNAESSFASDVGAYPHVTALPELTGTERPCSPCCSPCSALGPCERWRSSGGERSRRRLYLS